MEPLIPNHGGYRKLRSFQIAQLCYDVTVRFCDREIGVACALLDRQIESQARAFTEEGGFTERLHRIRVKARRAT